MTTRYGDKFNVYKNCRSVYIFRRIRGTQVYRVINKVKNASDKYIRYGRPCRVRRADLQKFINNVANYNQTHYGRIPHLLYRKQSTVGGVH